MKSKNKQFIVPQNGLRIICPELGSALADDGDYRELTPYWHKRQQAGDVKFYANEAAAKKAAKSKRS